MLTNATIDTFIGFYVGLVIGIDVFFPNEFDPQKIDTNGAIDLSMSLPNSALYVSTYQKH